MLPAGGEPLGLSNGLPPKYIHPALNGAGMPNNPTFEVYQDNADEWRWRLIASNGNIIADSSEGYASKQGVSRGIESVRKAVPKADVEMLS